MPDKPAYADQLPKIGTQRIREWAISAVVLRVSGVSPGQGNVSSSEREKGGDGNTRAGGCIPASQLHHSFQKTES